MDMNITSYDPKKVNVIVNGVIITGFASDSMISAAKSEDAVTVETGCQGDIAYAENANESGTITLSLQGTSSSLVKFRGWASKREEVSVVISDSNDSDPVQVSAQRCRVMKTPDLARGKTPGSVSISIFAPNLQIR